MINETRDTTVTFKELFREQSHLMQSMGWPGGKNQEGAHRHLNAAMVEVVEALCETNWKVWKPNYLDPLTEDQRIKFSTELTDIMQFVVNAAICMGLNEHDLSAGLRQKLVINHQRTAEGETTRES